MSSIHRVKAKAVFYPTLGWNMLLGRWLKVRNWYDLIESHVAVGAFPFARDVKNLAEVGFGGVVNTCEEYPGPIEAYRQFGIEQFHMPTIDFTHPSYEHVCDAVTFIERQIEQDRMVYVHCKAGRARSATVVLCWLMKHHNISAIEAQHRLLQKRPHINRYLTQRPVVQRFEQELIGRR